MLMHPLHDALDHGSTIVIIDNQTGKQIPSHELAERTFVSGLLINPKLLEVGVGQA